MTDMRGGRLLRGTAPAHTVFTLRVRVAHLSPSSSGAEAQLSLLEGDCVGLTWPIPQAGLSRARLFFRARCQLENKTAVIARSAATKQLFLVIAGLTRQCILFEKLFRSVMDARAFAAPKGLRPRRRVKPAHDERDK